MRVFPLAESQVLVGWVEGSRSYRAGILDVSDGSLKGSASLAGDLLGFLADDRLIWLLTSHGLHEVDRDSFSVLRTLRAGFPRHSTRMLRVGDSHVLVVVKYGQSHALVDLRAMSIVRRVRVPEPEIALREGDDAVLLSLRYGVRVHFSVHSRAKLDADAVPRGMGAALDAGRAIFVFGVPRPPSRTVDESGLDADRYVDLEPSGTITWLGSTGPSTSAPRSAGVSWVHGRTGDGGIVASDGGPTDAITRLVLLSPDGFTPRASYEFPSKAGRIALLGDSSALASPRLFGDPRTTFELVRLQTVSRPGAASAGT